MQHLRSLVRTMHHSSRLVALVAVVLLAVLAGGLAAGLAFVRSHSSTTIRPPRPTATGALAPSPTQTPGRTVVPVSGLVSIQMQNPTTGWAVTAENHILRTIDGAHHWQDVTPPSIDPPEGDQTNLTYDFFSPSLAWVASFIPGTMEARPIRSGTIKLFRTTDGGQTWSSMTMQGDVPSQIVFVSSQQGWMASLGGAAEGSEPVVIFRTSDGGATWTTVAQAGPSTAGQPGALPFAGGKSGIGVRDASTAWVTGAQIGPNLLVWLYVTHDGGATWQHQTLPIPAAVASAAYVMVVTRPPTFFTSQDGILPVSFDMGGGSALHAVYVTHDGGATWQNTALLSAGHFDYLTISQGWATDGSALFVTSDGGQDWTTLPADPHFQDVTVLTFVTSEVGWAISNPSSGPTTLLQTTDGGRTWMALQAP